MNSKYSLFAGAAAGVSAAILVAVLVAASGVVDVGSDSADGTLTRDILVYARTRSISTRAGDIKAPPLNDPHMIAEGAEHYSAMCTACHLAPGLGENEMRPGMNPRPPVLASLPRGNPAEQFWIIKHGIKMTGMPAWGVTHDDEEIWNMVAFLQKLPSLTPQQYHAIVAASGGQHEHDMNMDMGH